MRWEQSVDAPAAMLCLMVSQIVQAKHYSTTMMLTQTDRCQTLTLRDSRSTRAEKTQPTLSFITFLSVVKFLFHLQFLSSY